ncbi:hypothetical protein [Streptomyces sp. NPDC057438]|uniref:hypothetical protein n=1 Tax=Streptomyces sp. NPDC057438 TaxID=3346133 RepID=UPI003678BBEE
MKTFPRSTTIVSGAITGLAAACSSRASILIRRACGISEADMRNASAQPGRIGSGTSIRASSKAASTAFVPAGRRMAAQIVLDAISTAMVSSTLPVTPSSRTASTSSGVVSICTTSPGRAAMVGVNGASGRRACERLVVAASKLCRPSARAFTSR